MTIFDDWLAKAKDAETAKKKAERESRPKGQKCSNCLHHCGHPFSPRYQYCKLGKSSGTPNWCAKTKPGAWCQKWEVKP